MNSTDNGETTRPSNGPPAAGEQRLYKPPVIIKWGTLRELTEAVGSSGNSDGGKGKQPKRTR